MNTLVTGAEGMIGSHMIDYYYNNNISAIGTYNNSFTNINEIIAKAEFAQCDIRYLKDVFDIILKYKPKKIFHLAAQSIPTISWKKPQETMDINVNGTINLFETIKIIKSIDNSYDPIVIVACSSAEYGASIKPQNIPVKEEIQLQPLHPYGISKVAQDLLAYQYFVNDKIKTIRARIFNTTGPRKTNDVVSDFVKRAVEIEKNKGTNKLRVGNIETLRAITDVRDLVVALILLSDRGRYGEVYNICGSKVYKISEIIDMISDYMDIEFEIEVDQKLLRPTDEQIIVGDSSKLKKDTGWKQKYSLQKTIKDMVDYWRNKV